jgi:hypothetical protein
MSDLQIPASIIQLLSVLVGAGAGSYFGLKGAVNGIRKTTDRIDENVLKMTGKIDHIGWVIDQHRTDSTRQMTELKEGLKGGNK